ncbi:MAG: DNA topoisomerase IV [Flavobacteriaceae bacterium]|nr:DNA topoisomerase IV [Flavobacteriaceae bacterium]
MKLQYVIVVLVFFSCYNQERNCKNFQSGTFEFESISSKGDTLKTTFIRSNNLEIDYFNKKVDSSYVNWVSECECILKKVNPKNLSERKSIQMKILSTSNNEYVFEYSYVGDVKNKNRGKARKISD